MMLKLGLFVLVVLVAVVNCYPAEDLIDQEDAESFLDDHRVMDMIRRGLKYTGHEQRREAKEKYEERCERGMISNLRGKARWCPELTLWKEWNDATAKDPKSKKP